MAQSDPILPAPAAATERATVLVEQQTGATRDTFTPEQQDTVEAIAQAMREYAVSEFALAADDLRRQGNTWRNIMARNAEPFAYARYLDKWAATISGIPIPQRPRLGQSVIRWFRRAA